MVSQGMPIIEKTIEKQFKDHVIATATAVVGDRSYRDYDGSIVPFGYLNDMGSFPNDIADLWTAPDLSKQYRKEEFTINGVDGHLYGGWNGPYFQAVNENLEKNLRTEATGIVYMYFQRYPSPVVIILVEVPVGSTVEGFPLGSDGEVPL